MKYITDTNTTTNSESSTRNDEKVFECLAHFEPSLEIPSSCLVQVANDKMNLVFDNSVLEINYEDLILTAISRVESLVYCQLEYNISGLSSIPPAPEQETLELKIIPKDALLLDLLFEEICKQSSASLDVGECEDLEAGNGWFDESNLEEFLQNELNDNGKRRFEDAEEGPQR